MNKSHSHRLRPRPVVVVLGPTAVGKSLFALQLAKRNHGVIISADSRQVYRGLDIGSGKISTREMAGIPHYLLDVASPRGQYTAARFVRDVYRVMCTIPIHQTIFLVGGTPFYLEAVLHPDHIADVPPNPVLRKKLEKKTTSQLLVQLKKLDAKKFRTIDQHNRRRIIRALEILLATKTRPPKHYPPLRILKLGLRLPNQKLFSRIDRRVDERMKHGMLAEVARLHRQGLSWKKLDAFGLEYRFLSRHLRGQLTKPAALTQLKSATHHFARRQMTWWKRQADIHWVTSPTQAQKLIRSLLSS